MKKIYLLFLIILNLNNSIFSKKKFKINKNNTNIKLEQSNKFEFQEPNKNSKKIKLKNKSLIQHLNEILIGIKKAFIFVASLFFNFYLTILTLPIFGNGLGSLLFFLVLECFDLKLMKNYKKNHEKKIKSKYKLLTKRQKIKIKITNFFKSISNFFKKNIYYLILIPKTLSLISFIFFPEILLYPSIIVDSSFCI